MAAHKLCWYGHKQDCIALKAKKKTGSGGPQKSLPFFMNLKARWPCKTVFDQSSFCGYESILDHEATLAGRQPVHLDYIVGCHSQTCMSPCTLSWALDFLSYNKHIDFCSWKYWPCEFKVKTTFKKIYGEHVLPQRAYIIEIEISINSTQEDVQTCLVLRDDIHPILYLILCACA